MSVLMGLHNVTSAFCILLCLSLDLHTVISNFWDTEVKRNLQVHYPGLDNQTELLAWCSSFCCTLHYVYVCSRTWASLWTLKLFLFNSLRNCVCEWNIVLHFKVAFFMLFLEISPFDNLNLREVFQCCVASVCRTFHFNPLNMIYFDCNYWMYSEFNAIYTNYLIYMNC